MTARKHTPFMSSSDKPMVSWPVMERRADQTTASVRSLFCASKVSLCTRTSYCPEVKPVLVPVYRIVWGICLVKTPEEEPENAVPSIHGTESFRR